MLVPSLPESPWLGCSASSQDNGAAVPGSLESGCYYPYGDNLTLFEHLVTNANTVHRGLSCTAGCIARQANHG